MNLLGIFERCYVDVMNGACINFWRLLFVEVSMEKKRFDSSVCGTRNYFGSMETVLRSRTRTIELLSSIYRIVQMTSFFL